MLGGGVVHQSGLLLSRYNLKTGGVPVDVVARQEKEARCGTRASCGALELQERAS